MYLKNYLTISNVTLLVALTLSTVAAYYSIYGLTAIFAGAVIPVIVMGSILEIGKITTTVWLKKYWHKCSITLKFYLVPAVILLAFLTSMGIFGFLSKAHMEHGVTSGDVQTKLSILDEKIKTQKDNIDYARKALQQMDEQVNARLSRGDSENSAERAVTIRRQQTNERNKLLKEIQDSQKTIQVLNEERAPVAAENRKVEAEIGPIKYVAALIYGDNPDSNLLERAVRFVIIILVIVFDPLAIALVLAANSSKEWDKIDNQKTEDDTDKKTEILIDQKPEIKLKKTSDVIDRYADFQHENKTDNIELHPEDIPLINHAYLKKEWVHYVPNVEKVGPMVYVPESNNEIIDTTVTDIVTEPIEQENIIETFNEPVTKIKDETITDLNDGYVLYQGKHFSRQALQQLHPELFLTVDSDKKINTNFGTQFPQEANLGDIFVRVDSLPNKIFKFDGKRWIEINKNTTDSYLHDEEYIRYLINKLENLEYDPELLSDNEKQEIEDYLKKHNS
jgi:hypothetical protein